MKLLTTSSADIVQECRVMFDAKSVSKSIFKCRRNVLPVVVDFKMGVNRSQEHSWRRNLVLFLVDSCIPARQWTDICNTRCSILSHFSHFHVSHFPPLQHGAAFSCPQFHVSHFQRPRFFWYWFTQAVPDKGLLNGCVCGITWQVLIKLSSITY